MPRKREDPVVSSPPRYDRVALLERRAQQKEEGISAMAEYKQKQRATLERTAKLRAERLAQQAGSVEKLQAGSVEKKSIRKAH
jgi:hypothetical protein